MRLPGSSPSGDAGRSMGTPAIIGVLAVGALLRLVLLPGRGFDADLEFFADWSEKTLQLGLGSFTTETANYLPVYLYVLAGVAGVRRLFDIQFDTPLYRSLLKVPANVFDLFVAWRVYRWVDERFGPRSALLAFGLYWINPALIFDAAGWGQVDGMVAGLAVLTLLEASESRWFRAGGLFGLALMTKLQVILFAPLLLMLVVRRFGKLRVIGGAAVRAIVGVAVGLLVANLPMIFLGNGLYAGNVVLTAVGFHPLLSMGAWNVWWLLEGGEARRLWDGFRWLDGLRTREVGLALFGGVVLFLVVRMSVEPWRARVRDVLAWGALLGLSFYLLPTEIHERYLVYVLGVLGVLAALDRRFIAHWILVSMTAFGAMANNMQHAFPHSMAWLGWWPVDGWISQVFAALALLVWADLIRDRVGSRRHAWTAGLVFLPLLVGMTVVRLGFENRPMSLVELRPRHWEQGWRSLHYDTSASYQPLTVGGDVFEKGLGTHAPSRIVYRVDGRFARLVTGFGVDEGGQNPRNEVRFLIVGDGRTLFDSGPMRSPDGLRKTEVSLEGVRQLELIVDPGSDDMHFDHANWIEPVVYR